jgi:hypothetical protein
MTNVYRLRGTGLTRRAEIFFTQGNLKEATVEFNKQHRFEDWVQIAEQWAKKVLISAGHDAGKLEIEKRVWEIAGSAAEDSDEEFAARILRQIIKVRSAIKLGRAEGAAMAGVRLGQVVEAHDIKSNEERTWETGRNFRNRPKGGRNPRAASLKEKMADEYLALRKDPKNRCATNKDLMIQVGKNHNLKRSQSMKYIGEGRKMRSAKWFKADR